MTELIFLIVAMVVSFIGGTYYGWIVQGGPFVCDGEWYQAVVR